MKTFPVALCLEGEIAIVVGVTAEAARRADRLAEAGAEVRAFGAAASLELAELARQKRIEWHARSHEARDLEGARVVVLAEKNESLAAELRAQSRDMGFWLCAVDEPRFCDFVNVGVVRAGPVQLGISSGAAAPSLVRRLREDLAAGLDKRFSAFAEAVGAKRSELLRTESFREEAKGLLDGFSITMTVRYPKWFE